MTDLAAVAAARIGDRSAAPEIKDRKAEIKSLREKLGEVEQQQHRQAHPY